MRTRSEAAGAKGIVESKQVIDPVSGEPSMIAVARHGEPIDAEEECYVTYWWGAEKFSPVQYQTVDVGPFASSTRVRSGETRQQAYERLKVEVDAFAEREFRTKVEAHLKRIREASEMADRARAR